MSAKIKNLRRATHHQYRPKDVPARKFKKVYWPYLPLVILIALTLGLNLKTGNLAHRVTHPSVLAYADSMNSSALLADTNQERAKAGLAPLRDNSTLDQAAEAKAYDMVSRNYWDHNTPDGSPPWVFVTSRNYNYQKLGENLATGLSDEALTVAAWMASPPHRQNLLDSAYSEVGFGVAKSTNYSAAGGGPMTLVVAFYGEPAVSASLSSVRGSSASTPTSQAQLATASLPVAGLATDFAFGLIGAAIAVWLVRHSRAFARATANGERYIFTHPLFDTGLLILVALSYLLSRTAGLVH